MEKMFGVSVCVSTICKTIKLMGITRKTILYIALQQSEQLRAEIMAKISVYDPKSWMKVAVTEEIVPVNMDTV